MPRGRGYRIVRVWRAGHQLEVYPEARACEHKPVLLLLVRVLLALLGAGLVVSTLLSSIRSFVLPRGVSDRLLGGIFRVSRALFELRTKRAHSYADRDRAMAMYAPLTLLVVPAVWLVLVWLGYSGIFWAEGQHGWRAALVASGSSLLTLGFAAPASFPEALLIFSEAAIGLMLVALLIAYLPAIYAAWARREERVALLEVRAGSPPSAVEMLVRYHRIGRMDRLSTDWEQWEVWFANIEESHTSLSALAFFRSPRPERSWVTAAGAVLDAAALHLSTVDVPFDAAAALCIRAGFIALRRIAEFFDIAYEPNPRPDDDISVGRDEFDDACDRLAEAGLALRPDRDQAWRDFVGWRVNYDVVLVSLAGLTRAPQAPWSSDRSLRRPSAVAAKTGRRPDAKSPRSRRT